MVTSYLFFGTGLGFVHCGICLYIACVTCSRVIVLYSCYRVNWGTNMFVVFVNVTLILFLLSLRPGSILGVYKLVGRSPPCRSLHNTLGLLRKRGGSATVGQVAMANDHGHQRAAQTGGVGSRCSNCKKAFNRNGSTTSFLVFKLVIHAVAVISEVLHLSTKSRRSHCCMAHLWHRVLDG